MRPTLSRSHLQRPVRASGTAFNAGGIGGRRPLRARGPSLESALETVFAAADEKRDVLEPLRRVARLAGWLTFHPHRSEQSEAGFPDVVFVRVPRQDGARCGRPYIVFAECKREAGRLSAMQRVWGTALRSVELLSDGAIAYRVVRPSNRHEVEALLAEVALE